MINSDCASPCQATTLKPKEPVEHTESGDAENSVSGHSTEVRTLSVPAIIPRDPVHQQSRMSGLATFQGLSVSTTDGIKTPVESSTCEFSDKVIEKASDLFHCLHALTEIKEVAIDSYSTDSLFPYLRPESQGRLFCRTVSKKLARLLSDEGLSGEEKDQIMKIAVKRFNESHIYRDFQKKIINDFFEGVFVYLKQKAVFNNWESEGAECTSTAPFYTSMHKLMVEGMRRKDDVGWFPLNDEVGYLDRCCSAFMFLINELTMHPDREVNMPLLNKAASILGSITLYRDNYYGIVINKNKDNDFFVNLLMKGQVSNGTEMPARDFKRLMNDFCKEELEESESGYLYSESMSKKAPEDHKQLPYFEFNLKKVDIDNDWLNFRITYRTEDKQADCDELLKNYYKSVADKNEMLEIIEEVVSVCCEIQRRHPILDGNGRIFFFILSSVLLYQKGIWLKETLYRPWSLIDSKPPAYIAAKLVDLCIKRPVFSSALDWKAGLNEAERARVFCAMGELEEFKEIINRKPELLNARFRSSNISLLCAAGRNNRTEIVKFILDNYPDRTGQSELQFLLRDKDFLSYEPELLQALQKAALHVAQ